MEQKIAHSALAAALLALALAGCQKTEEAPAPQMPDSEAMPSEPTPMAEPAPGVEPAPADIPMEPVPGEAGEAAPTQPAPDGTPGTAQ